MSDTPTLGDDIRRLEEIVRRLEAEELPIEEALTLFEEGVGRLRSARTLPGRRGDARAPGAQGQQ